MCISSRNINIPCTYNMTSQDKIMLRLQYYKSLLAGQTIDSDVGYVSRSVIYDQSNKILTSKSTQQLTVLLDLSAEYTRTTTKLELGTYFLKY